MTSFPILRFSTCRQCHQPIRKDNVPWNNQWMREGRSGDRRCVTMIGCIPAAGSTEGATDGHLV